jgi:hypothetical protein
MGKGRFRKQFGTLGKHKWSEWLTRKWRKKFPNRDFTVGILKPE